MLQDYTSTQNDFRRLMAPVVSDPRRAMASGQGTSIDPSTHPQYQGLAQLNRSADPNYYQILLNRMQTQIDAFNAVRDIGKKFLDNSTNHTMTTAK
jgi:hypothetical protein